MASNNTASIAQARKLVEQLKMEANIDRIKVSRHTSSVRMNLLVGFRRLTVSCMHFTQFLTVQAAAGFFLSQLELA